MRAYLILAVALLFGCSPTHQPTAFRASPDGFQSMAFLSVAKPILKQTAARDTVTYNFSADGNLEFNVPMAQVPDGPDYNGFYFWMNLYGSQDFSGPPLWAVGAKPTTVNGADNIPGSAAAALDTVTLTDGVWNSRALELGTVNYQGNHYVVRVPINGHFQPRTFYGWYEAQTSQNGTIVDEIAKYNAVISAPLKFRGHHETEPFRP